MKISSVLSNYNNRAKQSFGKLYGLEDFNNDATHFDPERIKMLEAYVDKLDKKHPGIDCYLGREKDFYSENEQCGVFNFAERRSKPYNEPKSSILNWFLGKKEEKVLKIPEDVYSVEKRVPWDKLNRELDCQHSEQEIVFDKMCRLLEEGYERLIHCKEYGVKVKEMKSYLSKEEIVGFAKYLELTNYINFVKHVI